MKSKQYVVENLDNKLVAKWDDNVILFDSQEEAEEFIEMFPGFFKATNHRITSGIYFITDSINYKDIPKEKLIEECKEYK